MCAEDRAALTVEASARRIVLVDAVQCLSGIIRAVREAERVTFGVLLEPEQASVELAAQVPVRVYLWCYLLRGAC